jgi:class 3 adenylate cyclase
MLRFDCSAALEGCLEAERRQITVLFADMVGFTTFSERSGEEAAFNLMRGAVASCVGIWCDAISGIWRVPGQAARSIG